MRTYLFTFCLSLLISMGLTPLIIEFARRKKLHDEPNVRSVHTEAIPRLGGITIFASTVLVIIPVILLQNIIGAAFRKAAVQIIVILLSSGLMFLIGLIDDIKGIRIRTKFAGQILAAVLVCLAGIQIHAVSVEGLFTIHFGWFGFFLTVFWIVGVTNAVNFIDGLDGLAAGISCIACITIAGLSVYDENRILAVLMLTLSGSLVGFLFFNFSPAKIFMGDCGSLFLGFIIASSAVLTSAKSHAFVGIALPILVLGVPLFDAFLCILRRFLQRRSVASADRGHFHHRLMDLGFSQHHVAIIAYFVTFVMAMLGFLLIAARSTASIVIFMGCLLLLLLVFRIVGSVRIRETLSAIYARSEFARIQRIDRRIFEESQLHVQNINNFNDWWECLCLAAEKFGFSSMSLSLITRQNQTEILTWRSKADSRLLETDKMQLTIPIQDRRKGSCSTLSVEINKNGSLESATRKFTLFSRLLEEHGLSDL